MSLSILKEEEEEGVSEVKVKRNKENEIIPNGGRQTLL